MNPLDFRGPKFLLFFLLSAGFVLVWRAVLTPSFRSPSGDPAEEELKSLGSFDIAYLSGGWIAVADAAITALVHAGLVDFRSSSLYRTAATERKVSGSSYRDAPGVERRHPAERAILSAVVAKGHVSVAEARSTAQRAAQAVGRELGTRTSFALTSDRVFLGRLVTLSPLYGLALLGVVKILVGTARGKPVGLLVFILAAYAFVLLVVGLRFPHRSLRGDSALKRLRKDNAALEKTMTSAPQQVTADEAAMSYGLFGAAAFGGGLALLGNAFMTAGGGIASAEDEGGRWQKWTSGSSSSNGCGSSCGSSCGGGGGCGGCGGCGG